MTDFDFSEYFSDAGSYDAAVGDVRLEFVDYPSLSGEDVEFSFRAVGGTAPAGAVVAQVVVMSHDHNILGGGKTTIRNELGPNEVGASRIRPLQYTPNDGDYYLTITVGGDARNVAYRVSDRRVQAT